VRGGRGYQRELSRFGAARFSADRGTDVLTNYCLLITAHLLRYSLSSALPVAAMVWVQPD
jgi:hypothetical protein